MSLEAVISYAGVIMFLWGCVGGLIVGFAIAQRKPRWLGLKRDAK